MKDFIRKWLGYDEELRNMDIRIDALETLLLHSPSRFAGFNVLKRHLQQKNKPLPRFNGKPIDNQ